jgi:hypothetical protein
VEFRKAESLRFYLSILKFRPPRRWVGEGGRGGGGERALLGTTVHNGGSRAAPADSASHRAFLLPHPQWWSSILHGEDFPRTLLRGSPDSAVERKRENLLGVRGWREKELKRRPINDLKLLIFIRHSRFHFSRIHVLVTHAEIISLLTYSALRMDRFEFAMNLRVYFTSHIYVYTYKRTTYIQI